MPETTPNQVEGNMRVACEHEFREGQMASVTLMHGDCLDLMRGIPDGSVDLVLCDPPYGTMKGIDNRHDWDVAIEPICIFENVSRVLRYNGKCLLFSQEPYTSQLITSAIPSLPFAYRATWVKPTAGNSLMAKVAMVSRCEDICVFTNKPPFRRPCVATIMLGKAVERIGFYKFADLMFEEGRYKNVASARKNLSKKLPNDGTEKDYDNFFDRKMLEYLSKRIDFGFEVNWYLRQAQAYKSEIRTTFNLWQGNKSKSNVLEYAKDNDGYHPTQKPVALLEDLIKTFSNEGDTVLDFTMGSGSTGVACVNTGRNFIGIELDDGYFEIAQRRIDEAQATPKLAI